MSQAPVVTIILPTYNEALNIARLISAILDAVTVPAEVIVVDDDSPDGTWRLVQELTQREPRARLIHRTRERGLTSALQAGIDAALGDVVVWMDCDFSHPPEVIPQLLDKVLNQGYDIAVASRYVRGGQAKSGTQGTQDSWMGAAFSWVLYVFTQVMLDRRFKDYTSGFIAIKRQVLYEIQLRGDYGEYFIDLMVRAIRRGCRFVEIPFVNRPRLYGQSKTGTHVLQYMRRGVKYLVAIARLRLTALKSVFF
jgi:dolichol-phosphate mannosyltransferase